MKEKYFAAEKDREQPAISKIHQYLSRETVLEIVERETGVKQALLAAGTNRQIVMTMLYKYAGLNNREIGELLGVDYSTVSQGRKRLREKAAKDQKVRVLMQHIEQLCQE